MRRRARTWLALWVSRHTWAVPPPKNQLNWWARPQVRRLQPGRAMRHRLASRCFFTLALVVALLGAATSSNAGDLTSTRIAAASADGKRVAVFQLTNGYPDGTGALLATDGKPTDDQLTKPIAAASTGMFGEKVAPYAKWKWTPRPAALAELTAFTDAYDDKSAGSRARIVVDPDTRLARIEILQSDRWWPAKAMPGAHPVLTGTLILPGRFVIRTHHQADYSEWDQVTVITEGEVPHTAVRSEAARKAAKTATLALRQLRAEGARPFTKRPSGARDGAGWDYRRAKALDPAIEQWAVAAAYSPLGRDDLRDMIWLLAARDAPGQKLVALRLVIALRERDQPSADLLLRELENDPDTVPLVPLLRTGQDPLRRLPDPTVGVLTAVELARLSNEELLWLHRSVRAQGRFRFSDPALVEYFSLFAWYQPVSTKTWNKLLGDAFFLKNPDKSALIQRSKTLDAIVEAEKARSLEPPPL